MVISGNTAGGAATTLHTEQQLLGPRSRDLKDFPIIGDLLPGADGADDPVVCSRVLPHRAL